MTQRQDILLSLSRFSRNYHNIFIPLASTFSVTVSSIFSCLPCVIFHSVLVKAKVSKKQENNKKEVVSSHKVFTADRKSVKLPFFPRDFGKDSCPLTLNVTNVSKWYSGHYWLFTWKYLWIVVIWFKPGDLRESEHLRI